MNKAKMGNNINLKPWNIVSKTSEIQHHTMIKIITILIENDGDYFYIEDDDEKIKGVSNTPPYIKEDWINYNKKDIGIAILNQQIMRYEQSDSSEEKDEESLQLLKSLRRDLIIKGII